VRRNLVLPLAMVLAFAPLPACGVAAQTPAAPQPVDLSGPAAHLDDVSSVDAIITALYDVISGPSGQARDWDRMRSLFIPGGRLVPAVQRPGGVTTVRLMEVDDYITAIGPRLESIGFQEREVARRTEQFGQIAHVFSTYEGHMETEPTVVRGINSIQLLNDGTRWWVVTVFWDSERPNNPLPAQYLPPAD
jgi:hypothetical protein